LARQLVEETDFHQEMLARDVQQGDAASSEGAALAVRRKFGNPAAVRERIADAWGFPAIENVLQDLRFGARLLARSPAFALIAIVAIGLAIGINAGFFTLVDAFLFQPTPVANPERLVKLEVVDGRGQKGIQFSYADLQTISRASRTVQDAVAYENLPVALRTVPTRPGAIAAGAGCVSGNYFSALGGAAIVGRTLMPSDDSNGGPPVVTISEALWQGSFARAPDVVGRDIVVNGVHVNIVGVISANFVGVIPLIPDLWMTLSTATRLGVTPGRLLDPANRFFSIRARLREGVGPRQAEAELSGLLAEPPAAAGSQAALTRVAGVAVVDNSSLIAPSVQTFVVTAPGLCLVALVLVIACANLANLLLARALARQREMAVRLALGASRRRLLQQLLTESALIAVLGAALGLLSARWTVSIVSRAFFNALPFESLGVVALSIHPSWRVVAYTLALVTVSVLLFGLAPAMFATSPSLTASIKGEDAAFGTRIRRSRFRDVLVSAQVAACLILLAAAGTLVTSLGHLARGTTGLDTRRVMTAKLGLIGRGHVPPSLAASRATFAQRVADLPIVEATARTTNPPFTAWPFVHVTGDAGNGRGRGSILSVYSSVVTPRYFDVVGQRLVAGRPFVAADSAPGARVAIVTEVAARALWPREPAVGQTLRVAGSGDSTDTFYRIVGVVGDAHSTMVWQADDNGYVFFPATAVELATQEMPLLVRARRDLPALARELGDIATQVDPDSPLSAVPLSDAFVGELLPFKYGAGTAAVVGASGLMLAVVGLYGIVSFAVRQRRRDLAVHVAMGATPRDVLGLVLRRELRLVVIGLAAGLVGAAVISKILATIVLSLTPMGVGGFVVLPAALFVVALIATAIPAAGALRIAPMQLLRQD
jgi:predicted permease